MDLNLFQYEYPKELIAQQPLPERDQSRMMVLHPKTENWEHRTVANLPAALHASDLLIFNDTKVFPARLLGKDRQQRVVEILLLEKKPGGSECWRALAKPFKKIAEDAEICFAENFFGRVIRKDDGEILIHFFCGVMAGCKSLENGGVMDAIEKFGLPPLPPYIHRKTAADYSSVDRERYQSIFARHPGSAAAPTASLHFSEALIEKIKSRGVETASVTLHVGTDTFLPIRVADITHHKMHGEHFSVPKQTQEKIARAKAQGRKVIAVGTTAVRALESDWTQPITRLYITPGFQFKIVDGLLTNFHQPGSTLIAMVSAFAGCKFLLRAYQEAIAQKYRLFSYGDCMFIGQSSAQSI